MSEGENGSPAAVDGIWVCVTIGANCRRDESHLLGRGPVGEHMATRYEGEFGGSKQSVTDDEFVGRPSPGCRRSSFGDESPHLLPRPVRRRTGPW